MDLERLWLEEGGRKYRGWRYRCGWTIRVSREELKKLDSCREEDRCDWQPTDQVSTDGGTSLSPWGEGEKGKKEEREEEEEGVLKRAGGK